MMISQGDIKHEPACVVHLIGRLGEVANAFEAGKPLGPYLLDALLEDVELCPALQKAGGREARNLLRDAVQKARASVEVAVACPSVEREWAAQELRKAVASAQERLNAWCSDVLAGSDGPADGAIAGELESIGSPRCNGCAYANR